MAKKSTAKGRRTQLLQVRLTADEHRRLEKLAQANGLTVADWVRLIAIRQHSGRLTQIIVSSAPPRGEAAGK